MTTTAPNILGELSAFTSLTLCAICHERYDGGVHRPKLLGCANRHTLCLQCADRLLNGARQARCPTCQQSFVCPTGDAKYLPTNFELSKAMTEFQSILDHRTAGFINCCECRMNYDQHSFSLCRDCCMAKGSTCDPDSDIFDHKKLESLALCAGCVLASHSRPGHTIRPFVPFKVRRYHASAFSRASYIATSVATLRNMFEGTSNLRLDPNKIVRGVADVSKDSNSSLVFKDVKEFIEFNNRDLAKTVKQLNKAVDTETKRETLKYEATEDPEPNERTTRKLNNEGDNSADCGKPPIILFDSNNDEQKADSFITFSTVSNGGGLTDKEILDSDQEPEKIPDQRNADTYIDDSDWVIIRTKKKPTASSTSEVSDTEDDRDTSDISVIDIDEDGQNNFKKKTKTAFTKKLVEDAGNTSDISVEDDKEAAAEKKLSVERLSKNKSKENDETVFESGAEMVKNEKRQSTGRAAGEAEARRLVRTKKLVDIAGLSFNYKKLFDDCNTDKERVEQLESRLINNGIESPFTSELCSVLTLRHEQEAKTKNTIVDIGADTGCRYSDVTPPTPSVRRGHTKLASSDEDPDGHPQTFKEMFSNLRGMFSSGGRFS